MALVQDPDLLRSASHQHMIAHLPGPLAGGAVDTVVPVTAAGRLAVTHNAREPLLVVAPSKPLARRAWRLTARLDPDGAALALDPGLDFAPYTEPGAFLPLHRPGVDADTQTAAPFTLGLTLTERAEDGTVIPVPAADLAARLEVRLIEGNLGRLIYLMAAEKQRIRRQARELVAMRRLSTARDDALDRLGAELGVARFADALRFDAAQGEIVTVIRNDADGHAMAEPDDEYRRRLSLYRPFLIPNKRTLLTLLNGGGEAPAPNQGPLGELGFGPRVDLLESDNEFGVALQLVAAGGDQVRLNFLEHLRHVRLLWPSAAQAANTIHQHRFLSSSQRDQVEALRTRLRQTFLFADTMALAPLLAAALDRVGRCRQALGIATQWHVLRAQDDNAGSRYELGLGVDVEPLLAAELEQMRASLLDPQRPAVPDDAIETLLRSMTPLPAAQDPEAQWLLQPCGIRTVHRLNAGRMYLSHLPTFGLQITGNSNAAPGTQLDLEVRYQAPGDPGGNVVLVDALRETATRWVAGGGPAFNVLLDADASNRWDQAVAVVPPAPAFNVLLDAGLHAVPTPAPVVAQLKRLPPELVDTLLLDAPQAQNILAGAAGAAEDLRQLVELLREQGVTAVLPLITAANSVLLVVGVIGLPEVGTNLSDRRATGFRWYVVPIKGTGGAIKAIGSRSAFIPGAPGLSALVALGYARRGLTDPYELRVELPDNARLNLQQYEFLMNLLEQVCPLGVEINTFALRKRHVDLDDDGLAEPLPPTLSRTYRRFRRQRQRGEIGVPLEHRAL